MGKKVKRIGMAVSTGGLSELAGGSTGGIKDALFGAKDPGTRDRNAILDPELYKLTQKIRPMQTQAADVLGQRIGEIKGQDVGGLTNLITQNRIKGLAGQAQDAQRLAEQQIAKRGLGSSAVGLNALVNAGARQREQMGSIRAQSPLLRQQLEDQRISRLGQATGGLARLINTRDQSRAFIQGRESTGRGGGLLGLAAGAAGAYMGGPQGAQAGFNIGNSLGNMRLS